MTTIRLANPGLFTRSYCDQVYLRGLRHIYNKGSQPVTILFTQYFIFRPRISYIRIQAIKSGKCTRLSHNQGCTDVANSVKIKVSLRGSAFYFFQRATCLLQTSKRKTAYFIMKQIQCNTFITQYFSFTNLRTSNWKTSQ